MWMRRLIHGALSAALPAFLAAAAVASEQTVGVVVEIVQPGLGASRAGLVAGDVLLAWRRDSPPADPRAAAGELTSPFDLSEVERE